MRNALKGIIGTISMGKLSRTILLGYTWAPGAEVKTFFMNICSLVTEIDELITIKDRNTCNLTSKIGISKEAFMNMLKLMKELGASDKILQEKEILQIRD